MRATKLAFIPENGTVCTYEHKGDTLIIALHGKEGMEKQHRTEEETSDNPEDLVHDKHSILAEVVCSIREDCVYVEFAEVKGDEGEKGYTKLLYLKLALWCRKNHIHNILGEVANARGTPIFLRYKIPHSKTHLWINPKKEKVVAAAHKAGVHLVKEDFKFFGRDMFRVTDDKLSNQQMASITPCYVDTELLLCLALNQVKLPP
jgi:hypothetical protein